MVVSQPQSVEVEEREVRENGEMDLRGESEKGER
jgi:hypothetical protein